MPALIIISAIAVIFALILFCPLGIRISYNSFDDNSFCVKIIAGILHFRIVPGKDRKIRLSDYSPKNLRKKRLSGRKKKKPQPSAASEKPVKKKKKRSIRNTAAVLRYYLRCAKILLGKFGRRIKIKVYDFAVVISGDDPASTAICYGYVSQLAAYFFDYIENKADVHYSKKAVRTVNCDFTENNTKAFIDIRFTTRIVYILSLLTGALKAYLKKQRYS